MHALQEGATTARTTIDVPCSCLIKFGDSIMSMVSEHASIPEPQETRDIIMELLLVITLSKTTTIKLVKLSYL